MSRFSNLPPEDDDFLFCMICITNVKERKNNYINQKNILPKLALYDAITPYTDNFDKMCSNTNFHRDLIKQAGRRALWLSNIGVFEYFLKSSHKYLVVAQDDAVLPNNLEDILKKKYIYDDEYLKLGGIRLGQYACCNLYNKFCIKRILDTIKMEQYPIDRGMDHYISNIDASRARRTKLPKLLYWGGEIHTSWLPSTLVKVLNIKSMRINYDNDYSKILKKKSRQMSKRTMIFY